MKRLPMSIMIVAVATAVVFWISPAAFQSCSAQTISSSLPAVSKNAIAADDRSSPEDCDAPADSTSPGPGAQRSGTSTARRIGTFNRKTFRT